MGFPGYRSLVTSYWKMVHGFGLVPFTVFFTDRLNKVLRVLRVLKVLRFFVRVLQPLSPTVPSFPWPSARPILQGRRNRLERFLKVLRFLRFLECAAKHISQPALCRTIEPMNLFTENAFYRLFILAMLYELCIAPCCFPGYRLPATGYHDFHLANHTLLCYR